MSRAVREAFVRLYDAGLVYRKEALINWCCSLQSAISDIEVDHLHLTGPTEVRCPGSAKVFRRARLSWRRCLPWGCTGGCRAHPMMVPRCSRITMSFSPSPDPSGEDLFINCKELAREASEAVHSGRLALVPAHHRKAWHGWLDNITDWCVSRQLWWGHRIPVYRVTALDQREVWVAAHSLEEARRKAEEREGIPVASITSVAQEQDVLDTWFSSALFPFAALGWPGTQGQHATLTSRASTPPPCWRRVMTSCSSGWQEG
ncbi:Valine--tRNA ligase, mitochondrial [Chionoecetes opilio]|uniref:valine--tRNA ligase n=1 Tax=Chionoecetes opilio TaxID=41210 RepID=A0A8J4Y6T5_CHIOP|nr:Valine--tRNA ligase, mitochondrial [Chionoecetes opilio]